jgi:GNAT superfamily N-acetyltransferase
VAPALRRHDLPALPLPTIRHLVEVDHDLREALVMEAGGEVVGVARYDRSRAEPGSAEIAVVVEDAWQGMGLGRQLLVELTALAGRRGVRRVTATVQMDNDRMVGLIRRLLPGSRFAHDSGVYSVESPLSSPVPSSGPPEPVPLPC